jgi:hypothetical protein
MEKVMEQVLTYKEGLVLASVIALILAFYTHYQGLKYQELHYNIIGFIFNGIQYIILQLQLDAD